MSAYIVDEAHINYLVEAAVDWFPVDATFSYFHDGERHSFHNNNRETLGQMLWNENITSVAHRYNEDYKDTIPAHVFRYKRTTTPGTPDPIQVLKSIKCYEYQSCEHPGWKESASLAFCESLRMKAIQALPGYEDADWGYPGKH